MGACCSGSCQAEKSGELKGLSPNQTPRPIENQDNKFDKAMFEQLEANAAALKAKLAKASSQQEVRQVKDINDLFKCGKIVG